MEEGYNNATRVKLDITLEVPIIVLPVSSRKPFTDNLGNSRLQNHHNAIQHSEGLLPMFTRIFTRLAAPLRLTG